MRFHRKAFFFIFAFSTCLSVHAAPPRSVTALRVDQAPAIDGNLDDATWKAAKWQGDFTELTLGKPADPDTSFAIAYDDRFLYFAARCNEPSLAAVKATVSQRDDARLYFDDIVELFVAPGPQRTDYYQFEVNSNGVLLDAFGRQSGTVRDPSWNADVKVATSRGENEWIVEMAVPLADLDLGSAEPGDWGINVARVRRAGEGEQLSSFVPLAGSFHQPALFADLSLPGAKFETLRWQVPPPVGLTVSREDDDTRVSGKISIKNLTGKLRPVAVTPRLRLGDKVTKAEPISDILDAGQSKTYDFVLPLPGDGPQSFEVEVADRRDPESVFARRAFPVDLTYTPISLTLLEPAYQSAIYATEKIHQISGVLNIALSAKELEASSMSIALLPEDPKAKAVAEIQVPRLSSKVDFALPIPHMADGRYRLRIAMLDAKGQEIRAIEQVIRKLPPAPSGVEWRISKDGILLRNGEPFLPVGWFSLPASEMKQAGSNVTWLYLGPWHTVAEVRKALDEIQAVGGYAVIYPTSNNKRAEDMTVAPLSEEDAALILERVRAFKDHPALLAWYLADEPEYHRVLPESVEQLRAVISEEDPWRPTIVVNNTFAAISRFARSGDILAPDPYPFFKRGGISSSIGIVGAFVAEAAANVRPGQAVWVVPQAHDTRDFGGKGERAPTFLESRNMIYQAVGAGARGVVWWDWVWVAPNTIDSVLGNAYLARELNALKAYVLAPSEAEPEVAAPERDMIRSALRTVDGQHALFVTNASAAPQEVSIKAPALAGRELIVLGEGRTVKVAEDGTLAERLEPFGSHVYLTDPAFANFERMSVVQEKIDLANAARKQPGNLAFEDSGVTVRASSQGLFRPTPVWMVDGIYEGRSWNALPFVGGDWVELSWPKPQDIGRVVIFTDSIADAEIQIAGEDSTKPEWRSISSVKDASDNFIEFKFDSVKTSQLRIFVSRLRAGSDATRIGEIEAFQK